MIMNLNPPKKPQKEKIIIIIKDRTQGTNNICRESGVNQKGLAYSNWW